MASSSTVLTSLVWKLYEKKGTTSAKCKICGTDIKCERGSTSGMKQHAIRKHKKQYEDALKNVEKEKPKSIAEIFQQSDCSNCLKPVSRQAEDDKAIFEYLVSTNTPYRNVEHVTFKELTRTQRKVKSRTHYRGMLLPTYNAVKAKIMKVLHEGQPYVSFTIDTWTETNVGAFMSLTVHFVTPCYKHVSFDLAVKPFHEGKSAASQETFIRQMCNDWMIPLNRVHVIVTDQEAALVKACSQLGIAHISDPCHIINLVVDAGIKSQVAVSNALAKVRAMAIHYRQNDKSRTTLSKIQKELELPQKKLQLDVEHRWNSGYYMLAAFLAQRRAIEHHVQTSDALPFTELTLRDVQLLTKVHDLLKPFEEATDVLSAADCPMASVIPCARNLRAEIVNLEDSAGVGTMKEVLLDSVDGWKQVKGKVAKEKIKTDRFNMQNMCNNKIYALSAMLDPRLKDRFFQNHDAFRMQLTVWLREDLGERVPDAASSSTADIDTEVVSEKRVRTDFMARAYAIGDCDSPNQSTDADETVPNDKLYRHAIDFEVPAYLTATRLDPSKHSLQDVLDWWRLNEFVVFCIPLVFCKSSS